MMQYLWGFYTNPVDTWDRLSRKSDHDLLKKLPYVIILALLPPIAFVVGAAVSGWQVSRGGDLFLMPFNAAMQLGGLYYIGLITATLIVGYAIHWMSDTYGVSVSFGRGVMLAGFAATPLFILGLVAAYPVMWLVMLTVVFAMGHSAYLFYTGLPKMLHIDEDHGFVFSSAILTAVLIVAVGTLAASVIMWEHFAFPDVYRLPLR